MMNDLLRLLLAAADDVGRTFDHATVAAWPVGAVDTLRRLGLLRRGAGSLHAPCPNCRDHHVEPVVVSKRTGGLTRFFITCPESLRVEVTAEMCEYWEINPAGLAAAVTGLIGLKGRPQVVVADRFCRLGRVSWPPGPEKSRPVVFARCLGDGDSSELVRRVPMDGRTIVLTPSCVPDERIWPGKVPPVIPLTDVLHWDDAVLELDSEGLMDIVRATDETPYRAGGLEIMHDDLQLMIRRQLKADKKSELTDEAMLQAIKMYGGNARAAAKALNEEGYPVHHSTISRKLKKLRETHDIDREDDSPSVARTVASQRRDRVRKIEERR